MREYDLVADIGGTHSRLALAKAGVLLQESLLRSPHSENASFAALLERYLAGRKLRAACLAVAGPVSGQSAQLTNHSWQIKASEVPAKTCIINDLQATAYALSGFDAPAGPRLAVNLGTGLNATALHKIGGLWHAPASEAGYHRLPLLSPEENTILDHLAESFGAPVMEAVLSGPALPRLHAALTGERLSAHAITASWPGPTARLFARVLGAYLGDLALAHLPYGGIWLAGSLGRAAAPLTRAEAFKSTYSKERGAYAPMLHRLTINVLESDFAPLEGAALYLAQGQAARA